jgi:restriction endonuclease S subunit
MRDGWVEATLREALEPIANRPNGKDYPLVLSVTEKRGIIPQTEIFNHRIATDDISKYKVLEPMDIAYNPYLLWCGAIGQWQGTEAGVVSPVYECFRVKSNCEPRYLGYIFETGILTNYFDALAIGSIVRRRRTIPSDFIAAPIQLPPRPEQKRIVDLISSVDSYVEALRQQLESAKKSRNAVLNELLTSGGVDWHQYLVSNLISHSIGGIWGEEAGEDEVDVQVVRSTEFTSSGYLNFKTGVTRSIRRSQLLSRELKLGDILLEKSGGGPTQPVGRVVFVDDLIPAGTVCSNFVLLIRPNQELINPKFLFNILLLWHFNNRTLEYQAQTTGIRNLRTNDYLDQAVKIPSLSKQREVVALIDTFDTQIKNTNSAVHEAQTLRSGLLADLLSGIHEIPASYDKVIGTA